MFFRYLYLDDLRSMEYKLIYIYFLIFFFGKTAWSQDPAQYGQFHIPVVSWKPLPYAKIQVLDLVEALVKKNAPLQNASGAIIDPYLQREHQYSTPYFAHAVGTLLHNGRGQEFLEHGLAAMEKALSDFRNGTVHIPDQHGEFYIAALAKAIPLYQSSVDQDTYDDWLLKIKTPLRVIWKGADKSLNNWRTYVMKGEWERAVRGWADKDSVVDFIEHNWQNETQKLRIAHDPQGLYQDWSSDPQSLAVEAVGRGNLTAIALGGYDGASAEEIRNAITRGALTSLQLMSPTGQCPPNGRTDNHVFNDILYQLIFQAHASAAKKAGDKQRAGQFQRAAALCFQSIQRWIRKDEKWAGALSITKNHFEPGDRIGYQPASQWGNYSGAMMFHLAEAVELMDETIEQVPVPAEIGGYATETNHSFGTFTANAGGMQVVINLRGASIPKYDKYWTPLGAVRFSKVNWDDRLGPSDGIRNLSSQPTESSIWPGTGLTFGPSWKRGDAWVRLADMAHHYQGKVDVKFVHPLLVKFRVTYTYVTGLGGPYFYQDFTVTPDGIFTKLSSPQDIPYGNSIPLLINDGRKLTYQVQDGIASTSYPQGGDSQHFICINRIAHLDTTDFPLRSTYGDLLPVTYTTDENENVIFIYPAGSDDPDARMVRESFQESAEGFLSVLGSVQGTIYRGRTSAGGYGSGLDLNNDGDEELQFDTACHFIVLHSEGHITRLETDRQVVYEYEGKKGNVSPFSTVYLER